MTDIYTNTSAFGLMSEEMQAQMKAHPGPWERYNGTVIHLTGSKKDE